MGEEKSYTEIFRWIHVFTLHCFDGRIVFDSHQIRIRKCNWILSQTWNNPYAWCVVDKLNVRYHWYEYEDDESAGKWTIFHPLEIGCSHSVCVCLRWCVCIQVIPVELRMYAIFPAIVIREISPPCDNNNSVLSPRNGEITRHVLSSPKENITPSASFIKQIIVLAFHFSN